MGFKQAMKLYRKAVFWSFVVSLSIIMEAYDTQLIGSFFGFPPFQKKYGEPYKGGYQIQAQWQVALSLSSTVGVIIGIFANGYLAERFGHKRVLLVAYVVISCTIFITFFAPSVEVLFVGELLSGLPWGIFATMSVAYASEVCPVALRGYLTTYVNLCWVIGHFLAAAVLDGLIDNKTQWAYRIPFAVQWVWPVPLFFLSLFAPESPWWLVRKGRLVDAEACVRRLSSKNEAEARQYVAMMVHTNNLEKELESGTSYWDCFKGVDLRRTEISCIAWGSQTLSGFCLQANNTYFFENAGLADSNAYKLSLGFYALGIVGNISSWFLITKFGRRTIYLGGFCIMTMLMFIIGFLSLAPASNSGAQWATAIILLVWVLFYDLTLGPVAYAIVSETSATRLRNKTIGLARNTMNLVGLINSVVSPYMINPTQGDWKGKAGFLAGGLSTLCLLWGYFRMPELKGRTYEEVDILFEKRIPARAFSSYEVDAFEYAEQKALIKS